MPCVVLLFGWFLDGNVNGWAVCATDTAFDIVAWVRQVHRNRVHFAFSVRAKKLVHGYTISKVIKACTVLPLDHVPGTEPVEVMFAARV